MADLAELRLSRLSPFSLRGSCPRPVVVHSVSQKCSGRLLLFMYVLPILQASLASGASCHALALLCCETTTLLDTTLDLEDSLDYAGHSH